MKIKHICILFFSLFLNLSFAQLPVKDSIPAMSRKYTPNFMLGVDVLNAGLSFFSERKLYQGFVSSRITNKIHAVADLGFEKNTYQKNNYDAEVSGPFLKLGAFYMLAQDYENAFNGFYGGGKLAAAFYKQQYFAVPVRGFEGGDFTQAFPESNQSSYWIEGSLGGRVQLFESPFYIDVNLQPKYLLFTTKQDDIKPMIVPGFGRSSTKFNLGFAWNVAYRF